MDSKGEILPGGRGVKVAAVARIPLASQPSHSCFQGPRQSRLPGFCLRCTLLNLFPTGMWACLDIPLRVPLPSPCPKPQARTLQDIGCGGSWHKLELRHRVQEGPYECPTDN